MLDGVDVNQTFEEYRQLGYACQIKKYNTYEEAHKELFDGFFSVETTKERLIRGQFGDRKFLYVKHII